MVKYDIISFVYLTELDKAELGANFPFFTPVKRTVVGVGALSAIFLHLLRTKISSHIFGGNWSILVSLGANPQIYFVSISVDCHSQSQRPHSQDSGEFPILQYNLIITVMHFQ